METLSITSKKPFSIKCLEEILSKHWGVEASADSTLVVHGGGRRCYIHPDTESQKAEEYRLLLDYSDVELAKSLLEQIADDPGFTVDNDFGTVVSGSEFVARCKAEAGWDWRR